MFILLTSPTAWRKALALSGPRITLSGERRPEGVLGGQLRAGMGSVWESSLESKEGCAWDGALHISAREGEPACPRLGRAHQPLEDRVPAAGLTFPLKTGKTWGTHVWPSSARVSEPPAAPGEEGGADKVPKV